MKYIAVALLVAVLTPTVARAQSPNQESRQSSSPRADQGPETSVQPQPDSPLRLSVSTRWVSDGRGYEVSTVVQNVGDRAVTAYATRYAPEGEPRGGCALWNIMSPGRVLRPGQSDVKSTWRGFSPSDPLLTYAVDFIEFTDGATWGADVCHSAERLAGERAGGRAAASRLLELLAEGGPEAVKRAFGDGVSDVAPPAGHSTVWEEGFRIGVKVIAGRARRAVEEFGPEEIEHTLKRPYDAAGSR